MAEHDLAALAGRLRNRVADLQRRRRPAAVMNDWPSLHERLVHLFHLEQAGPATAMDRDFPFSVVAIDKDAVGRLTDIATLKTGDCYAEPGDMRARAHGRVI